MRALLGELGTRRPVIVGFATAAPVAGITKGEFAAWAFRQEGDVACRARIRPALKRGRFGQSLCSKSRRVKLGDSDTAVNGTRACSSDSCADPAVICFAELEFCVKHFVSRCYEDLNHFDVRANGSELTHFVPADLKTFVEECSRCALTVSLRCQKLDNLQRGRLLDILLWANELLLQTSVVVRSMRVPLSARGTKRESFTNVAQSIKDASE